MVRMEAIPNTSHSLFPTLVKEYDLRSVVDPYHAALIAELVMERGSEGKSWDDAKWNLFPQTVTSYAEWERGGAKVIENPQFDDLRKSSTSCLRDYEKENGLRGNVISSSWINIGYKDAVVKEHRHGNVAVSMTYYPHFPEGSANLMLVSPIVNHFRDEDHTNIRTTQDHKNPTVYTEWEHELTIKEGFLYIFPGWVRHYTTKSKSDKRIVVGMNCTLK